jgi:glycosyltransferase involved in cell wall biosynthesis
MPQFRLAIVTPRFWPLIGDEQTHLLRLTEALLAAGHAATVVTPRWKRSWPEQMLIGAVPLVRLRGSVRGGWSTLRWMYALAGWLRGQRLDAVLVAGLKHEAYVALRAALRTSTPTLLLASEDDLGWHRSATLGTRIAACCQQARTIIAPSEEIVAELCRSGFASDCFTVIPRRSPIPAPRRPQLRDEARAALAAINYDLVTTANSQVALAVGRLDTAHRFGDLVRAWRIVTARRPEARLWIVGDGPERDRLYRQISDLDQRFRALLPGIFDCWEDLLQASDMLLLPAAGAAAPISMLDAQAAGLPVIAAHSTAIGRHVIPAQTGLLYPAGDIQALAAAILDLIDHPAAAVGYGAAARSAAQASSTIDDEAAAYIELVQRLQSTA